MFKLDMVAMVAALALISAMYFGLQRKEVKLQSNDVWKSVWENVVSKGLKKIDANISNIKTYYVENMETISTELTDLILDQVTLLENTKKSISLDNKREALIELLKVK